MALGTGTTTLETPLESVPKSVMFAAEEAPPLSAGTPTSTHPLEGGTPEAVAAECTTKSVEFAGEVAAERTTKSVDSRRTRRRTSKRAVIKPYSKARKTVLLQDDAPLARKTLLPPTEDMQATLADGIAALNSTETNGARDQFALRQLHSMRTGHFDKKDFEAATNSWELDAKVGLRKRTLPTEKTIEVEELFEEDDANAKSMGKSDPRLQRVRNKLNLLVAMRVATRTENQKSGWLQRAQPGWFSSWGSIWVVVTGRQMRWFNSPDDRLPLGSLDFDLVRCEVECLWDCPMVESASRGEACGSNRLSTQSDSRNRRANCLGCDLSQPVSSGIASWFYGSTVIFRICPVGGDLALELQAADAQEGNAWVSILARKIREADEDGETTVSKSSTQLRDRDEARLHLRAAIQEGDRWWTVKRISQRKFESIARTGDLLLFKTPGAIPQLIRTAGGGQYDHVALLLRLASGSIAMLEATGTQGVGLCTWEEFTERGWHLIYQEIALRRVNFERSEQLITDLQEWAVSVLGRPYGLTMSKLFQRKSVSAGGEAHDGAFFCSELVAEGLKVLSVLPRGKSSTQFWPSTFEVDVEDLKCTPGCSFDEQLTIDFTIDAKLQDAKEKRNKQFENGKERDATTNIGFW